MDNTKLRLLIPLAGIKKSPSAKNSLSKDKLSLLDLEDSGKKFQLTKSKLLSGPIYNSAERKLNKLNVKKDMYGHVKSKIGSLNKPPRRPENISIGETKAETGSLDKKDSKSCII
jgi:hypothetical protein